MRTDRGVIAEVGFMSITADTLTEDDIRGELALAIDSGDRDYARLAQIARGTWKGAHRWQSTRRSCLPACDTCGRDPDDEMHIDVARAAIATAINARGSAKRGEPGEPGVVSAVVCAWCDRTISVDDRGLLRRHGRGGQRCQGSGTHQSRHPLSPSEMWRK